MTVIVIDWNSIVQGIASLVPDLISAIGSLPPAIIAVIGGMLPVLFWLWFWLREDSSHPEPRWLIALTFLGGMLVVVPVIALEDFVAGFLVSQTLIFIAWAAIEELMKFGAAYLTALRRRDNDEPIDPVVYMITTALGFAGIENVLFLLNGNLSGHVLSQLLLTGDLRSVGANLLHVLASATIGVAIGYSFYRPRRARALWTTLGVILAIALHSAFNILIMNAAPADLLRTFSLVWIGLIVLLAILEFIKRIPRRVVSYRR